LSLLWVRYVSYSISATHWGIGQTMLGVWLNNWDVVYYSLYVIYTTTQNSHRLYNRNKDVYIVNSRLIVVTTDHDDFIRPTTLDGGGDQQFFLLYSKSVAHRRRRHGIATILQRLSGSSRPVSRSSADYSRDPLHVGGAWRSCRTWKFVGRCREERTASVGRSAKAGSCRRRSFLLCFAHYRIMTDAQPCRPPLDLLPSPRDRRPHVTTAVSLNFQLMYILFVVAVVLR